ncbi:MAG: hypothetical protein HYV07_27890 [Deltaproteobacteria bacterium]|nr:hypothetical protein [Deltaproteobacteria bacterium]
MAPRLQRQAFSAPLGRGSMTFFAALADSILGCVPPSVELIVPGANPGDLVVVATGSSLGLDQVARTDRLGRVPLTRDELDNARVFTFVLDRSAVVDARGDPMSDESFASLEPTLVSNSQPDCGCMVPSIRSPQVMMPGDSCPIPDWSEGRAWIGTGDGLRPSDDGLGAIRDQLRLSLPGECTCVPPARAGPTPFELCPIEPLIALWPPSRVAISDSGTAALFGRTSISLIDTSGHSRFWLRDDQDEVAAAVALPLGCGFLEARSAARTQWTRYRLDAEPEAAAIPSTFGVFGAELLPDSSLLLFGYDRVARDRGPAALRCQVDDGCNVECTTEWIGPTAARCAEPGEDLPGRIEALAVFGSSGRAVGGTDTGRTLVRDPQGLWSCGPRRFPVRGSPSEVIDDLLLHHGGSVRLSSGEDRVAFCGIGRRGGRFESMIVTAVLSDSGAALAAPLGLEVVSTRGAVEECAGVAAAGAGTLLVTTSRGEGLAIDADGQVSTYRDGRPFRPDGDAFWRISSNGSWMIGLHRGGEVYRHSGGAASERVFGTSLFADEEPVLVEVPGDGGFLRFVRGGVAKIEVAERATAAICDSLRRAPSSPVHPEGVSVTPLRLTPGDLLSDADRVDVVVASGPREFVAFGRRRVEGEQRVFVIRASVSGDAFDGVREWLELDGAPVSSARVLDAAKLRDDALAVLVDESRLLEVSNGRARELSSGTAPRPAGLAAIDAANGVAWAVGRGALLRVAPADGSFRLEPEWLSRFALHAAVPPLVQSEPIELWDVRVACPNRASFAGIEHIAEDRGGADTYAPSFEIQDPSVQCESGPARNGGSRELRLCATPGYELGRDVRFGASPGLIVGNRPPFKYVYADGFVEQPGAPMQRAESDHLASAAAGGADGRVLAIGARHGRVMLALPKE